MKELLTPEQLSYLKGLTSKNKQRKFLLDCILENIANTDLDKNLTDHKTSILETLTNYPAIHSKYKRESPILFTTHDGVEIKKGDTCWVVLEYGKYIESIPVKTLVFEYFEEAEGSITKHHYFSTEELAKEYIENNKPKEFEEPLKFDMLKNDSVFLSPNQVAAVIDWMNNWEQLKDTAIPLRFKEDFLNTEYKNPIK